MARIAKHAHIASDLRQHRPGRDAIDARNRIQAADEILIRLDVLFDLGRKAGNLILQLPHLLEQVSEQPAW